MRILFDHGTPRGIARVLSAHTILTGDYTEWGTGWGPTDLPAGQKLREPSPLFKKLDPV